MNQKLEQVVHLLLIWYHQINISVSKLESDALPAEEWKFIRFSNILVDEMLSKHPKPGVDTSDQYTLNVTYVAAGAGYLVAKLFVLILQMLFPFLLLRQLDQVCSYLILILISEFPLRFFGGDGYVPRVLRQIEEGWVVSEILDIGLESVVVFETFYAMVVEVYLTVQDFFNVELMSVDPLTVPLVLLTVVLDYVTRAPSPA